MVGGRRKLLEVLYSVATSERCWACSWNFPRSSYLILLARPCSGNASPHENPGTAPRYTGTVPGLWKWLRVPVIWQEWETLSPHKCAKILGIFELCVCSFLLKIISISRTIYLAGLIIFFWDKDNLGWNHTYYTCATCRVYRNDLWNEMAALSGSWSS